MIGGLVAIVLAGWGVSQILPNPEDEPGPAEVAEAAVAAPAVATPDVPVVEIAAVEAAVTEAETPAAAPPEPEPPPAPVCEICPAMVDLPGGTFQMGSPVTESGREPIEGPVREVTVKPFAISKTEITHAEWITCVEAGGCNGHRPGAPANDAMPAAAISWRDASAYAKWLSAETGQTYRLPTEAE